MRTSFRPLATPRVALAALAVGACAALAGCGTPAVVKPSQNPLPGFTRDIQAAHSVVDQSAREAQAFGTTGVTAP